MHRNLAYRNSHSNANKQHIYPKTDRHRARLVPKLMVQSPRYRAAQPKGQHHTRQPHAERDLPVADEEPQVDLQPDEEQEQHQAEVGDEVEVRHGGGGEDGGREAGDAAHDGRAEQDAADDFGDDAGLAKLGEGVVQQAAEDYDDAGLGEERSVGGGTEGLAEAVLG